MMLWRKSLWLIGSLLSLFLVGCATTPSSYNYDALLAAKPRSILVIPPKNSSLEVNAPYVFLSTISKPLGEKGYYVFPVAVIETFLKENGLPTPEEMNLVPMVVEQPGRGDAIDGAGQGFDPLLQGCVVSFDISADVYVPERLHGIGAQRLELG